MSLRPAGIFFQCQEDSVSWALGRLRGLCSEVNILISLRHVCTYTVSPKCRGSPFIPHHLASCQCTHGGLTFPLAQAQLLSLTRFRANPSCQAPGSCTPTEAVFQDSQELVAITGNDLGLTTENMLGFNTHTPQILRSIKYYVVINTNPSRLDSVPRRQAIIEPHFIGEVRSYNHSQ